MYCVMRSCYVNYKSVYNISVLIVCIINIMAVYWGVRVRVWVRNFFLLLFFFFWDVYQSIMIIDMDVTIQKTRLSFELQSQFVCEEDKLYYRYYLYTNSISLTTPGFDCF